jgi:hypothetical protein
MPRGSKKGERRGGRRRGTPNKATVAKAAALASVSADPTITPLQFLLGVMRDPKAPTDLRIKVARAAAQVQGKLKNASVEDRAGDESTAGGRDGFIIDIAEAKVFRSMEHRLAVLLRKQAGPRENGGPPTAAEIVEETKLRAMIGERAQALVCPPGYGPGDALNDSNRLHQLHCKRLSPPSCGGGELKGAEDEEEAFLTARVAAYRYSPEGRDRDRIRALEWKDISGCLSPDEKAELDNLKLVYPENPSANSREQSTRRAELRRPFAK